LTTRPHLMVPSARELRNRQTGAEARLWAILKDRRLEGLKFRRQHPVGPFVVDFCCPSSRLVIELDGKVHEEMIEQDEERTRLLNAAGYRVIRFKNKELFNQPDAVITQIAELARAIESPLATID
jgi:very-short-patch-repair endonuclease